MNEIRLQKRLSQGGIVSRRAAEALISQGRVTVNGIVVQVLGSKVAPTDEVRLDGELVPSGGEALVYVILNKPRGFITTAMDTHNRPTVMDLVRDITIRVFPVGRLDQDTEGLLLFTNDGDLAHKLMHPSIGIEKTYVVTVHGAMADEAIKALEHGVVLDDGPTQPAKVKLVSKTKHSTRLELVISEGRNRQVRRMVSAVGYRVDHLQRVAFGTLQLADLPLGNYRRLTGAEIAGLKTLTSRRIGD